MGKFIDLTNKRFGQLVVIEYYGKSTWLCKCDCGNTKVVAAYSLKSGATKSCGHNTTAFKDLTGQKFGELIVTKYLGNSYWECLCSCGKITKVHRSNLRSGNIKSCGHLLEARKQDIIGNKYGHLTVKKYLGNKLYECECDCENKTITNVFRHNLLSGGTKSCGCDRYKYESIEAYMNCINSYIEKYNDKPSISDISDELCVGEATVRKYIDRFGLNEYINKRYGSRFEKEIHSIVPKYKMHDRVVLSGEELDFLDISHKTAIEFNGSYWHSEINKDKYYHQRKTIECSKANVRLIHIFEYEWTDTRKKDILKSLISTDNKQTVMARKCDIQYVENAEAKEFLNKYHLQGYVSADVTLACIYNNEIIGIMSFGKPRFNEQYQYELIRLCWKNDVAVVGGIQRLFSRFVNDYKPTNIITYCDSSKFTGDSYINIGFIPLKEYITEPNYVWVSEDKKTVLSRYQTQKKKLLELGLGSSEQSESDIMHSIGYYRVYDCGNYKLEWKACK